MVSSSVSPRYSRCFSPFPHGTRPLSVSQEYLALADGAACFRGDSSGPPLLRIPPQVTIATPTGLSPPAVDFPKSFGLNRHPLGWSYNPGRALTRPVWAVPRSLAATCGITLVFFSWGYLDVSVPPVRLPSQRRDDRLRRPGCPIRTPADQSVCAAPRRFSQLAASFIASESLGIPHAPLFRLRLPPLSLFSSLVSSMSMNSRWTLGPTLRAAPV